MSGPGTKQQQAPTAPTDLRDLGRRLLAHGPVKTLRTPRRVRIRLGGAWVADTTAALYVWEHPWYPYYYVPRADFVPGALRPLAVLLAIAVGIIVDGVVGALIAVPLLAFSKSFAQELGGAPADAPVVLPEGEASTG